MFQRKRSSWFPKKRKILAGLWSNLRTSYETGFNTVNQKSWQFKWRQRLEPECTNYVQGVRTEWGASLLLPYHFYEAYFFIYLLHLFIHFSRIAFTCSKLSTIKNFKFLIIFFLFGYSTDMTRNLQQKLEKWKT